MSNRHGGIAPRPVTVQKQDDFPEVLAQEFLLPERKGATHQCHHARQSRLVHLEAIEETLHDDDAFALGRGPVEIEKHKRFSESHWEAIPRLCLVDRSPGIRDQKATLIVNRYHNAALHRTLAVVVADAEIASDFRFDAPLGQVRVRAIDPSERKVQRCVAVA